MTARILIIDDEPRWISFAEGDLGAIFEVEVAASLDTALAKLAQKSFDLVIASSRFSHTLEAIRRQYPQKRIVVATGQPTTREAIKMYRLGASDYFAKDFREEVVSEKIRGVIKLKSKKSK